MKILWIKSDFPLPADTGGKIRTKCLLVELAKRHSITFLCYAPSKLEHKWFEQMKEYGIEVETITRDEEIKNGPRFLLSVLSGMLSDNPYIVDKCYTSEMAERLIRLSTSGRFDIVVCDFLEMAWCRHHIKGLPVVLFEHNVETMIWRRYCQVENNPLKKFYFSYEKNRMARFEQEACSAVDLVFTVSENDGELLKREFGIKHYVAIPTGVDIEYFRPMGEEISGRLVFSGSMDWMPNIDGFWWFYNSVLPSLRSEVADLSLTVVGRRPTSDIVRAGSIDERLTVTGTVDDVRPYIGEGQVYIVPLRVGGGTRIKIYEAMAMKKCVLSTSIGAEGLPVTDGENIVIADGRVEFKKKLRELLQDDNKRNKIALAGYRLVTEKQSWSNAAKVFDQGLSQIFINSSKVTEV